MRKDLFLMAILSLTLQNSVSAADCVSDGSSVTVSGVVATKIVKADPGDGIRGFSYLRIILDHPVCLKEGDFDGVPSGKSAALTSSTSPKMFANIREGQHVTVTGTVSPKQRSTEPPEPLMLDLRTIR